MAPIRPDDGDERELRSERVVYRRAAPADVEPLRTHWARAEVRRYLWDDEIVTEEHVRAAVSRGETAERAFGGGLWCMDRGGTFVGTCGLLPVFPELDSLLTAVVDEELLARIGDAPLVEVLYSLEPHAWGAGLAREATKAMLRFGHATLGLPVIFGGTDVPNERSRRTLDGTGMREYARFDGDVGPLVYFVSVAG